MNKVIRYLEQNSLIFLDLVAFMVMLLVNVLIGYELYSNVVGEVAPTDSTKVAVSVTKLVTLERDNMAIFEEDQVRRVAFDSGTPDGYEMSWYSLSRQINPF